MSATYLPNRIVGPGFHEIQLFGQQTFEEPDWKEALRIFNDDIMREEPGSMMRPYLSVEGVTLHYDQDTYSYFVYGKMPAKDEEEEYPAIRAETGRVVQASLKDARAVQYAIAQFLADDTYTILGLYAGKATEVGSPTLMFKKTSEPGIFILKAENLLQREDEALEMAMMRCRK